MMPADMLRHERATVSAYFPVGGPVAAADLVGRESYLRRLVDRLEDGNHVLIAGPRRIGKTSIILEALRRLKRRGAHTAYVDCLGATDIRGLGERLADAILPNLSGVERSFEQGKAVAARLLPLRGAARSHRRRRPPLRDRSGRLARILTGEVRREEDGDRRHERRPAARRDGRASAGHDAGLRRALLPDARQRRAHRHAGLPGGRVRAGDARAGAAVRSPLVRARVTQVSAAGREADRASRSAVRGGRRRRTRAAPGGAARARGAAGTRSGGTSRSRPL